MITEQVTRPVRIWTYVAALLVGLLLGGAIGWGLQSWRLGAKVAKVEATDAKKDAAAERAARQVAEDKRKKEQTHAQDSNTNEAQLVDDLKKLAAAEARRADDARQRAAEFERLRDSGAKREATTRAWAKAESTARNDLADRLVVVEGQLERGVGMVEEGRAVVGRLQGALERRDAEVAAQQRQIVIERKLTSDVEESSSGG